MRSKLGQPRVATKTALSETDREEAQEVKGLQLAGQLIAGDSLNTHWSNPKTAESSIG